MSSAFHRQFEDQLGRLKLLAAEFARDNPALAPMLLGSGSDPDVERLLEGTAFLTSLLRSRLDDAFPEFVQDLTRLLLPHYLLPTPSSAMMVFRSKVDDGCPLHVPAGTEVLSEPIDGTRCRFRTCHDLLVPALEVRECSLLRAPGRPPLLRLQMRAAPGAEAPEKLRLFIHASHADACHWLLLLSRHLRSIRATCSGPASAVSASQARAQEHTLAPQSVRLAGFDHPLLDYPPQAFDGFLADYVGINSFVRLELEDTQSSRVFRWIPRTGNRSTL